MRIVDVCAFYTPFGGGVKTYVDRKLRAARGDDEVIILAPGERDGIENTGNGRIVTLASPRLPLDRRYRYFADETALHCALDRLAPDVIEVSSPWGSPGMVARWQGQAFRSLVMHADPLAAYAYRWFNGVASRQTIDRGFDWFWRHLRRLDGQFDLVVSASASLSARLSAGGLRKVTTIPMGVEPAIFSPQRRSDALRRQLLSHCGLDERATLLLGLGRHASEKRWPMVIEAASAAGYDHPIGLLILGDGRDERRALRAASNNPHVHLAAPVRDRPALAAILASADALVHGCEAETFCMVAAEAKASGLPLIVPDEGGASDQYEEGSGARYAARSAASLADAIRRFVSADLRRQRGAATRASSVVPSMDDHFACLFGTYRRHGLERVALAHAA